MNTKNATKWLPCGQGTMIDAHAHEPVTTQVVELAGFGRIFEVYHYGNDPEGTQRLINCAPELLAALMEWQAHKFTRPISDHPEAVEQRRIYDLMTAAIAKATA